MDSIPEVDPEQAKARLDAGDAIFMDVRDPGSYRAAHIPGALHVGDHNIQQLLDTTDADATIIIYCYHGHSSLGGAAYLLEHGFDHTFSLRGGFEGWRGAFPGDTTPAEGGGP